MRQPSGPAAAAKFIPGGVARPGAMLQHEAVSALIEEQRRAQQFAERTRELSGIVVCFGGRVAPTIDVEHHWIEMGDESYGWWPSRMPATDSDAAMAGLAGVPGILKRPYTAAW